MMAHALASVLLVGSIGALSSRAFAALPASGCELVPAGQFGPVSQEEVRAETVVSGLEVPWAIAFLPGSRDLLVTERPGRVRLVRAGKLVERPVLTVPVAGRSEGGVLGLALDPEFVRNRRFFLYRTLEKSGRQVNRLESYVLAPDSATARVEKVLLDDIPAERYHDGGRLRFGSDRLLYLGTGDAGAPPLARRRDSLAGKILRLAPDGAIPPTNPFPGSPVFVMGLRNVQAFDWRSDGALVVADHGPSGELGRRGHDRVLVVPRAAGADLGWPDAYGCEALPGMPPPALSWVDAVPPGGASFYTGDAIPAWRGSLLVGTLGSRHLHRVAFRAERVERHEVVLRGEPPQGLGRLREVVMGPDGALWITTSNCDGRGSCPPEKDRIVRIVR